MLETNSSKIIKLVALRHEKNETDNLIRNHDGNVLHVKNAPIIRALAKGLGVTFNIVMPEDNEYGIKKPDGTWSGIIGMLTRGEADLSMAALGVTNERRKAVNFTDPVSATDITFMTDKPEPYPKSFAVFDVFSLEVWICLGICLILMSHFLYFFFDRRVNYFTILVDCIGCLLEQSFSYGGRQGSTKTYLLYWFLGITVLTNSYKAAILSFITVPRMVGIRNIADLSKAATENSFACMMPKGSVAWQYKSGNEKFKPLSECLKRSEAESLYSYQQFLKYPYKKAFIAERLHLSEFQRGYFISEDAFTLSFGAIAYSKQFCCPKKLQNVAHRIVAANLIPKMFRDRDFKAFLRFPYRINDDYDGSRWKPLNIKDFTGAFLVLVIGYFCSIMVYIVEIVGKKFPN